MVNDINFDWSFDEFEIRVRQDRRSNDEEDAPARLPIELVKWDEARKNCFTLAWWRATSEGYELQFVGARPFVEIGADDIAVIWPQLRAAQKMLDAYYEAWTGECWR